MSCFVKDLRKWSIKKSIQIWCPNDLEGALAMLSVTTLKIRKLSCTQNFLQLYALLFMAQRYLYLSQQKY
jgi:hypothetical protein